MNDHTPTTDSKAALHWAAVAVSLAETRTLQGNPLTAEERVEFNRYQDAARSHGHTDADIRAYLARLL